MKQIWTDLGLIEAVLPDDDGHISRAWQRVVAAALTPYVGASPPIASSPPENDGGLGMEQISKNGWWNDVPLPNTIGMERLLFRIVKALEVLAGGLPNVDIAGELFGIESEMVRLRQGRDGGGDGLVSATGFKLGAVVNGEYQVSFCDFCGGVLGLDGKCVICDGGEGE